MMYKFQAYPCQVIMPDIWLELVPVASVMSVDKLRYIVLDDCLSTLCRLLQERERELAKNATAQQPHISHMQVQQAAHQKFGGNTLNPVQLIEVATTNAKMEQQRRMQEQAAATAAAAAAAQAAASQQLQAQQSAAAQQQASVSHCYV
jgi:hypothetical protein